MKILSLAGALLFLASRFLCQAYAIELCEPGDYYSLANSSRCKMKYNKAGDKGGSQEAMFEIMKNYPFEGKDAFAKLLKSKIELIDNYKKQLQGQGQTKKVEANISKLEQTKNSLSEQLGMVNGATQENWVSVRGQARKALEEAARSLRDVE